MPATLADRARALQARAARAPRRRPWGRAARALPPLLLMTDEARLPDPEAALDALPKGSGVVFRHYGAPGRKALASRVIRKARARGLLVLIAGDAGLARSLHADGLHLPEGLRDRPGILPKRRKSAIVTIAAHSLRAVFKAWRRGADAVLLGPVFPTASHPGAPPIGPLRFAAWCRKSPVPVYALGGVNAETARRLGDSRAAGFAGIGGLRARKPRSGAPA